MNEIQTNDSRIRALVHTGDYQGADAACYELLGGDDDAGVYHLLGYSALNSGRYDAAVEGFSRAVDLGLTEWSNYYFLARCLAIQGRAADALSAFSAAYGLAPHDVNAASAFLEATLRTSGLDAAVSLHRSMSEGISDVAFHQQWALLMDAFVPDDVLAKLSSGAIGAAENQVRGLLKTHRTRGLYLLHRYIRRHQRWRAYTGRPGGASGQETKAQHHADHLQP